MLVEVLGVRVRDAGPVVHAEVTLRPGLTAFAGLNGVGKTQLLNALMEALAGTSQRSLTRQVVLRVRPHETDSSRLTRFMAESVGLDTDTWHDSIVKALAERLDELVTGGPYQEWDFVARQAVTRERPYVRVPPDDLAREIIEQGNFALVPVPQGGFEVWLALDPHVEAGAIRAYMNYAAGSWDQTAGMYLTVAEEECDAPPEPWDDDPFGNDFWADMDQPYPYRSDELPVPVVRLASFDSEQWPISVFDGDGNLDIDELTRARVASTLTSEDRLLGLMTDTDDSQSMTIGEKTITWAQGPVSTVGLLSRLASTWLDRLLPGAGPVRCQLAPAHTWLTQQPICWRVADPYDPSHLIDLEDLGQGHRRWARFSIAATLQHADARDIGWFFADEPEQAIHRSAEHQLAHSLKRMTRDLPMNVLVATHSPAIVAEADTVRVVNRDEWGKAQLDVPPDSAADVAAQLGLDPSDVLAWYGNLVMVEGLHDQIVVEGFLREELARSRSMVVRLGGLKDTSAVFDGQVVSAFSRARLILLVDALGQEIEAWWRRLQKLALQHPGQARRELFQRLKDRRDYESRFLLSAGERLLKRGELGRLTVCALAVPDVLDLLPADKLVPGQDSWSELRDAFRRESGARSGSEFKAWLRGRGAKLSLREIRRAVADMQTVPDDIARLARILDSCDRGTETIEQPANEITED